MASSVLAALDNSDISEFSDAESDFTADERTVGISADKTNISERTRDSPSADKTNSSKPSPWDVNSEDLNLEKWKTQRNKRSLKEEPKTYKMSLKGPAPGPSAKPRELKFVKKNIIVKR